MENLKRIRVTLENKVLVEPKGHNEKIHLKNGKKIVDIGEKINFGHLKEEI